MSEAIPPLPNTPSWRGAQLKKNTGIIAIIATFGVFVVDERLQHVFEG
jgi:hypothetical protein